MPPADAFDLRPKRRHQMRRLIAILTVGVFLSVAGIAAADTAPTTPATAPTTNHPTGPGHWFAGTVTAVGSTTLTVGVLWTGPNDGSLNGQSVTLNVTDKTRINKGRQGPIALAAIQAGDLVAVRAGGPSPSA